MKNKSFELPPWYDDGKYYDIVKDFNVFDFYFNLNIRYLISKIICDERKYSAFIKTVNWKKLIDSDEHIYLDAQKDVVKNQITDLVEMWIKSPLSKDPDNFINDYFTKFCGESVVDNKHLRKDKFRDKLYTKTIKPLSWRQIKSIDLELQSFARSELNLKEKDLYNKHVKSHISQFNVERENLEFHQNIKPYLDDNTFDVIYEPICSYLGGLDSHNVQLNIDLRSPDSALIEDFQTMLKQIRLSEKFSFEKGKKNNQTSFGRWVEFKLFEYFDITLWFAYTNQKVTDAQMGNLLFPDEVDKDITAVIRGSTRKYLDHFLTDKFHEKLYWEAWLSNNNSKKV